MRTIFDVKYKNMNSAFYRFLPIPSVVASCFQIFELDLPLERD